MDADVSQLATLTGRVIDFLDIPPCPLIGLGFGGWVAADLATQDSNRLSELVLVSPWGVKPTVGEIADFVLFDLAEWAARGFHDQDYVCGPMRRRTSARTAAELGQRPRDGLGNRLEAGRTQPSASPMLAHSRCPDVGGLGRRRCHRPAGVRPRLGRRLCPTRNTVVIAKQATRSTSRPRSGWRATCRIYQFAPHD